MPVIERNGMQYIRGQVEGGRYCRSTKLRSNERNRKKAEILDLKQVEELSMARRFNIQPVQNVPFSKALVACLEWMKVEFPRPRTIVSYRCALKRCAAFFGDAIVRGIAPGDVEQFKVYGLPGRKPGTVNLWLAALWNFFEFCRKKRWCASNPVEEVKKFPVWKVARTRALSFDEERQYLTKVKAEDLFFYDFARMLGAHGLRPMEAGKLAKVDVHLEEGKFHIVDAKTPAGDRWVEMTEETREILTRRLNSPSRFIFPRPTSPEQHISIDNIFRMHKRALKGTGLEFVPYAFRHSFATRLIEAGVDLFTVAALMGHANTQTLMRYVHPAKKIGRDAMEVYDRQRAQRLAS